MNEDEEYTWRDHVQSCLESLIADLDYDLHKSLECHEEDGRNSYPDITDQFISHMNHYDK